MTAWNADADAIINSVPAPENPTGLYWLSFVDEAGFLGAAMVPASGVVSAARAAWALGCNPGGEMKCVGPLPAEFAAAVDEKWIGRLMSKADCAAFDEEMDVHE